MRISRCCIGSSSAISSSSPLPPPPRASPLIEVYNSFNTVGRCTVVACSLCIVPHVLFCSVCVHSGWHQHPGRRYPETRSDVRGSLYARVRAPGGAEAGVSQADTHPEPGACRCLDLFVVVLVVAVSQQFIFTASVGAGLVRLRFVSMRCCCGSCSACTPPVSHACPALAMINNTGLADGAAGERHGRNFGHGLRENPGVFAPRHDPYQRPGLAENYNEH